MMRMIPVSMLCLGNRGCLKGMKSINWDCSKLNPVSAVQRKLNYMPATLEVTPAGMD